MVWLATVDGGVCHSLMPGMRCDDDARQCTSYGPTLQGERYPSGVLSVSHSRQSASSQGLSREYPRPSRQSVLPESSLGRSGLPSGEDINRM